MTRRFGGQAGICWMEELWASIESRLIKYSMPDVFTTVLWIKVRVVVEVMAGLARSMLSPTIRFGFRPLRITRRLESGM